MLSDFAGKPLGSPKRPRGTKRVSNDPDEVTRALRALQRRSKRSEREFARWLQSHDGSDPRYKNLTSSTGRIGHVTGLQADAVSAHYLAECKNVRVPSTLAKWWNQIVVKATEWHKDPLLMWEPSNENIKLPIMHIMTAERHAELLMKEKWYDQQQRRK